MIIRDQIEFLVTDHGLNDSALINLISKACGEVSQRIVKLDPSQAENFMHTFSLASNEGVHIVGDVVAVVRENGTEGQFEPATKIAMQDRFLATNSDSLKYRSKWNPGFYIMNKNAGEYDGTEGGNFDFAQKIYIVPTPNSSNNAHEAAYITQLIYRPTDLTLTGVLDSVSISGEVADSTLYVFPSKWEQLVLLNVAMQIIENKLQQVALDDEDEEVFAVFQDMKKDYQSRYETEFSYIAQGNPQKDQGEQREG